VNEISSAWIDPLLSLLMDEDSTAGIISLKLFPEELLMLLGGALKRWKWKRRRDEENEEKKTSSFSSSLRRFHFQRRDHDR
jgi:hypothetical protein